MFVDSRQRVEVCKELGELSSVDTPFAAWRRSPRQPFIDRALNRLRQSFASALAS